MYYSAKMNAFFPSILKNDYVAAGTWPEDSVEISERWHSYLLDGQMKGKIITPDEYGMPVLMAQPEPTFEEIIVAAAEKKAELMQLANDAIRPLEDAVEFGIETPEETNSLIAWKKYRVLLNRVDVEKPVWPEVPENVA
jgi:hypothetical protein